ncbi:MAG: C45 family peptidase [Victivallales bacterium]
MWHIQLTGNPDELGRTYARLLKAKLSYYLPETRKNLRYHERGDKLTALCKRIFQNIADSFPCLAREIEGCADEMSMSKEDMVMLVAINDFWWGLDYSRSPSMEGGKSAAYGDCTNLGIRRNCMEPLFAQTYDLPDPGSFFVQTLRPDGGFSMILVPRIAPAQTHCGVNERGLCLGSVSSSCNTQNLDGIPINVILRAILQNCASIQEAVKLIKKHRVLSGGYTVQVMQENGDSAVMEVSAARVEVIESDKPYLFNTRFTNPKMREYYKKIPKGFCEKRAENRLRTFERLLQNEAQPYSLDTMKRVLSDHSPEGPIWDWSTPLGIVMFPRRKSVSVYEGAPDISRAESYGL